MFFDALLNTQAFFVCLALFGLLIGSFLNVVILRLPVILNHQWRCQCEELLEIASETSPPPSIALSRSRCPKCQRQLSALENVPLLSFLFLRGKCAGCQRRISIRYPLVEATCAILFVFVGFTYGPTISCIAALTFTAILLCLTVIDLDHQLLPDSLTLPLVWLGLLFSLTNNFTDPVSSILGAVFGYMSLWSVFHVFKLLTGKEGMGYGDFKLMAAMGAWLGWQSLPLVILLSSVVGAVVGVIMLSMNRKDMQQPIPFGPFISIAGWICLLWGKDLLDYYFKAAGLAS